MSHHLDSPLVRQAIRPDITDPYLFRGETGKGSIGFMR
jgi:hypothetical protein